LLKNLFYHFGQRCPILADGEPLISMEGIGIYANEWAVDCLRLRCGAEMSLMIVRAFNAEVIEEVRFAFRTGEIARDAA
jgi:hypothetical protein